MKRGIFTIALALILIAACQKSSTPMSTPTLHPSSAPSITPTPVPTKTTTSSPPATPTPPTPEELNYSFNLDAEKVDVIWNEDGSLTLTYELTFTNYLTSPPIDFVDVYIPSSTFNLQNIQAQVNGLDITHIEKSTYFPGAIELGLEQNAIPPGETGVISTQINQIFDVLYSSPEDELSLSAVFFPTWFDEDLIRGFTDLTVTFHLPANVQQAGTRVHQSPPGWPEPIQDIDATDHITYTWKNPIALGSSHYLFGLSFPKESVAANAIIDVIQLDAMYAKSFYLRGRDYGEAGEFKKAILDFNHAIYLNPDFTFAYYSRGYAYGAVKQFDQAIDNFDIAIDLDPTYAQAYFTRGLVYVLIGDQDQAIADYTQAILLDPEHALAYMNRGWAYAELEERDKAISDLEKALELGLDVRTEQTAKALLEDLRGE